MFLKCSKISSESDQKPGTANASRQREVSGTGRYRFGLRSRRQLRQRRGRTRHRTVRDGGRQTPPPVEKHRPARIGNHEMGLLVQQRPTAWSDRVLNPEKRTTRFANKRRSLKNSLDVE